MNVDSDAIILVRLISGGLLQLYLFLVFGTYFNRVFVIHIILDEF